MNDTLKNEHFERITSEHARNMYDCLCAACEQREGGMTDADQMLVFDVAYAEQIKELLRADIEKRGIGRMGRNGRQEYWQDNRSVSHFRAYCDQQRKLMAELRLTPNARRAANMTLDDDGFDDFPG